MTRTDDALTRLSEISTADRTPVPRSVSGSLRALILGGELKPGDRLPSQRDLAERLGVSRPSVREALTELEAMGLVVVKVGSGVYVAPSDGRAPLWRFSDRCSPRDVYEARIGLEGYAAGLAAGRAGPEGSARLGACVDDMRAALHRDDIAAMAAADAAFHDLMFELAGNPVLAGMYRPVRDLLVASQHLPMAQRRGLDETLREHETILARITAGETAAAAAAMEDHIRSAARRYGLAFP